MGKACDKDSVLELTECGFVLYYLEAVLILKHLQRPGVVEHMTVKEWDSRVSVQSGHCIVGVKEHKTAAQQVAVFALSDEEEMWFSIYYTHVRPQVIKAQSKKRKRDEAEEESEPRTLTLNMHYHFTFLFSFVITLRLLLLSK
ncbi:hypothetical protein AAFF_G00417270 [Aldrovandia affinis]|uniref:Uncharacterized protein n=1 Tax=Aldrovandia affinis TaxID=143900 RepID=A0AAD7VYX2_9TELE|nr:hypothetical protein AAFF_G00417270 [Aldrovandia affinis]